MSSKNCGKQTAARRKAIRQYQAAVRTLAQVQRDRNEAFKRAYPTGADIRWRHGPHLQSGEVILHGYGDRLKVLNFGTGRQVWVEGGRICHD